MDGFDMEMTRNEVEVRSKFIFKHILINILTSHNQGVKHGLI